MEKNKHQNILMAKSVWEQYLSQEITQAAIAKNLGLGKNTVSNILKYTIPEMYDNTGEEALEKLNHKIQKLEKLAYRDGEFYLVRKRKKIYMRQRTYKSLCKVQKQKIRELEQTLTKYEDNK